MEENKMSLARLFCVVIFCLSSAFGELCFDEECLTKGANVIYSQYLPGTTDNISLDPLHLDLIEGGSTTLKYKLYNATLIGLMKCHVDLLRLSLEDTKYNYNMGCPHLTLEADYEMEGKIDSEFIEGKGTCKIEHYDYNFLFHGDYNKIVKNGKLYTSPANHILDIEPKGKVHFDFKNLYNGDKQKSDAMHKFANEHWPIVDKLICQPVLNPFMDKLLEKLNAFLENTPSEVHFSKQT